MWWTGGRITYRLADEPSGGDMRKLQATCITALIALVAVPVAITGALAGADDATVAADVVVTDAAVAQATLAADEPTGGPGEATPAPTAAPAPVEATTPPTTVAPAPEPAPVTAPTPSVAAPAPHEVAVAMTPAPVTPATIAPPECDPNYSGCVPVGIGDIDCPDAGRNLQVIGIDIHRMDRDGNGIACEHGQVPDTTIPAAPSAEAADPPAAQVLAAVQVACDPNYSGCVPTDVGDVNCDGAGGTNLTVLGTDVHALDSDGDGIACEDDASATPVGVASAGLPASSLAVTGGSTALGGLGSGALLVGLALVGMAGVIATLEHRRRRGGFVVVSTNWLGEETRSRVVAPRPGRRPRRRS
jgi:Excalibur calcium-binding domain